MRNLFIIIAIAVSVIGSAQNKSNLHITKSEIFKDLVKSDSIISSFTSSDEDVIIMRSDRKNIYFDIFGKQLINRSSYAIELERREEYLGNILYDNKINILTETLLTRDTKALYRYSFDLGSKSINKKELSKITIDKNLGLFSNEKGSSLAISPNSKYIGLITYTVHRDKIYLQTRVFDATSFELIYDKQITRTENAFYEIEEILIDDDKNVFLLGNTYFDEENPKLKNQEEQYYLLEKFTATDYSKLEINYPDKYVKGLNPSESNRIYNLYGFYSDKSISKIKGTLHVSIDLDQFKIIKSDFKNLPDKLYNELLDSKRKEKKEKKELSRSHPHKTLIDSDKNIYFVLEETFSTTGGGYYHNPEAGTGTGTGAGGVVGGGGPSYGNIAIIKIKKDGEIDWSQAIKRSASKPSNIFLKNDQLHILTNSGKDLKVLKDGRTKLSQGVFQSSSLYDIEFEKNGDYSINKIQDNKNNNTYAPNHGDSYNGRFVILNSSEMHPSRAKSKRQLITLE